MVIQRNKPIVFRGIANTGEAVKVSFNGHTLSALADGAGKWKVSFPKQEAGGPYKAVISTKKQKLTIKDIYVGGGMALFRTVEYGVASECCTE